MARPALRCRDGHAGAQAPDIHGGHRLARAPRSPGRCGVIPAHQNEIVQRGLSFLLIREQLSLGWKILFLSSAAECFSDE